MFVKKFCWKRRLHFEIYFIFRIFLCFFFHFKFATWFSDIHPWFWCISKSYFYIVFCNIYDSIYLCFKRK